MQEEQFIELIYKSLKGEITEDEASQIERAIASNSNFHSLKEEITLAWQLSDNTETIVELDLEADLKKTKTKFNKKSNKTRSLYSFLSVAASLILIVGALTLFQLNSNELTITAENGTESVKFDDGSQIWINEGSQLVYPKKFNKNYRTVQLKGEGFFEIAKDPNRPFIVNLESVKVRVLGTRFNISETGNQTEVAVKSGRVLVSTSTDSIELKKNEVANYLINSGLIKLNQSTVNRDYWRSKRFVYQNKSLLYIMKELKQLFQIDYQIDNKDLLKCEISILINSIDIEEVLNKICDTLDIEVSKTNETQYILQGGSCN